MSPIPTGHASRASVLTTDVPRPPSTEPSTGKRSNRAKGVPLQAQKTHKPLPLLNIAAYLFKFLFADFPACIALFQHVQRASRLTLRRRLPP